MDLANNLDLVTQGMATIGSDGGLVLDGLAARELAAHYGTPLVVISQRVVARNCREYLKLGDIYPRARIYYASKALLTTGFASLLAQEGVGVDVVSCGELHTALTGGMPPEDILLHGNAKTSEVLLLALQNKVGRIVIDNLAEIPRLGKLVQEVGVKQKVMVRVTPGVKPDTHKHIQTGQQDSKFGFNLEGGAAAAACTLVTEQPSLELVGLHCHIGSQIHDIEPFRDAVGRMLEFFVEVKENLRAPLEELNIGGGLGINYAVTNNAPQISDYLPVVSEAVLHKCKGLGLEPPVLCLEPGRSIVGPAGVTLYTVQSVKEIPGVRNYLSVDGGMADNPRHALYQANHPVLLANKAAEPADQTWSVAGPCCETGDMLATGVALPHPSPGDLIAVLCTGAYTYSMAGNYNRFPKPAVVLINDGKSALLARRESSEDLLRLDETPSWIAGK